MKRRRRNRRREVILPPPSRSQAHEEARQLFQQLKHAKLGLQDKSQIEFPVGRGFKARLPKVDGESG
jgi:hypothetical protein